jgi:hypothetical protein
MTSMVKNVVEAFNRGGEAGTHKPGYFSAKEGPTNLRCCSNLSRSLGLGIVDTGFASMKAKSKSTAGMGTVEHEETFGDQVEEVSYICRCLGVGLLMNLFFPLGGIERTDREDVL